MGRFSGIGDWQFTPATKFGKKGINKKDCTLIIRAWITTQPLKQWDVAREYG